LKRIKINENPDIGAKSAKLLLRSMANAYVEHLELVNIGARPGTATIASRAMRVPLVAWKYLDLSGNDFSRAGLNEIFWAMRQNKRLRVLKLSMTKAGTLFCANADALLTHGISVPKMLQLNSVLRVLDLSFNTLCTEAGINILDAMIDNRTIKRLSLRGNLLDDNIALMIPDLLRCNNVLEELDLGHNRLGFSCAYSLAESLEANRSLRILILDYNRFGGAGSATLDTFCKSLMMNYTLQVMILDGNKLGPDWGFKLAEAFARNNTLNQVSLRDNRLDSRAGIALLQSYTHAKYLFELALSSDEIGDPLWEQFRKVFEIKRSALNPENFMEDTKLTVAQTALMASYGMY
jgi:Ran GTPase-activating protein (RanGAP) involved in mRNA processing and transport